MPITFNQSTQRIVITSPTTAVTIQQLLDAIRAEEQSVRGMAFDKIANASGKEALSGSVSTGITLVLLDNWQIEPYAGNYTLTINGGNLVQGTTSDPVAYVVGGPQVELTLAVSAAIVTSGSGLSSDEQDRLERIEQLLRNKYVTNPATGKAEIYNDAGNAVLFEADLFEDADGSQAYRGQGAERRERFE